MPAGSALTNGDITDADTTSPSFTADAEGRFRLRFVVNDGSATDKDFVNVDTAYTYSYSTDVQAIYDNDCTSGCHSGAAPSAGGSRARASRHRRAHRPPRAPPPRSQR